MFQHSTPKFLLKHFTDSDGHLFFFDKNKPDSRVRKASPKKLLRHEHLYSTIERDGTRRIDLEDFYGKVETRAAPIVKKILESARAGRLSGLSPTERQEWDLFFYNQWRRVPDCFEKFSFEDAELLDFIAEYERDVRPLTAEERAYWERSDTIARFRHNVHVDVLKKQSDRVLEILDWRGLGIAVIKKPNRSFITGSFPVVKLTNPETPELDHPTTEAWLAIASDVAITPAGERGEERIVIVNEHHHIRALNEALFRQSTIIAGRSRALIASLAGARRTG